jgi:hypothetical protein
MFSSETEKKKEHFIKENNLIQCLMSVYDLFILRVTVVMFVSKVIKKIFVPKRNEVTGRWRVL